MFFRRGERENTNSFRNSGQDNLSVLLSLVSCDYDVVLSSDPLVPRLSFFFYDFFSSNEAV